MRTGLDAEADEEDFSLFKIHHSEFLILSGPWDCKRGRLVCTQEAGRSVTDTVHHFHCGLEEQITRQSHALQTVSAPPATRNQFRLHQGRGAAAEKHRREIAQRRAGGLPLELAQHRICILRMRDLGPAYRCGGEVAVRTLLEAPRKMDVNRKRHGRRALCRLWSARASCH